MSAKNCGTVINADTNAAINILRKVAPNAPLGSSGTVDVHIQIRTLDVKLLWDPTQQGGVVHSTINYFFFYTRIFLAFCTVTFFK